jgi:hypothetical protein
MQWVSNAAGQMGSEAQRILRALIDIAWNRTGKETSAVVTGTAGTSGNLAAWDANGDLVDASAAIGAMPDNTFRVVDNTDPTKKLAFEVSGLPSGTTTWTVSANALTWLGTPSSANLATLVTDETGSGALVFANTPTLVTPILGAATATSINFGGSTLSNYTETTFTVTAALATPGTSSWSYAVQAGRVTRTGRGSHWSMNLNATPTIGTGSGIISFSGYPYNANGTQVSGSFELTSASWTWPVGRAMVVPRFATGAGAMTMRASGTGLASIDFASGNLTGGSAHAFLASGYLEVA